MINKIKNFLKYNELYVGLVAILMMCLIALCALNDFSKNMKRKKLAERIDNQAESIQWCVDEIEMQYEKHEWEEYKKECYE